MKFLVILVLLSLVALARSTDTVEASSASSTASYDVVVVGAGAAGITAARTLVDGGKSNIIILEANCDRYGGRINTMFVPGYPDPIEGGASFFHDSNYNPTIAIGIQAGMTFEPMNFDSNYAWKDGRFLNVNQRTRIYNNYLSTWEAADPYYEQGLSYAEILELGGYDFDDRGVETLLMNDEQVFGDNLEQISSVGVDAPPGELGDQLIVTSQGGYKQLLDYLLDSPTSIRSKLRLGAVVTKIDLTTPSNKLTITYTQNGVQKKIIANDVIVTVSMGMLKSRSINFVPNLPVDYRRSIDNAVFGNVNKGFLFFGPNSAVAQKLALYPVNIFYKIAVGDNPRYNDQLTYFYNNLNIKGQASIQSFYVGNYSRMTETLSDNQVLNLHRTALNFLEKNNQGLLPQPNKFVRTQWGEEEYIKGSYTAFGVDSTLDDFLLLNKPIQNKLYFAGEHVLIEGEEENSVSASIGCVYTSYISAKFASDSILAK